MRERWPWWLILAVAVLLYGWELIYKYLRQRDFQEWDDRIKLPWLAWMWDIQIRTECKGAESAAKDFNQWEETMHHVFARKFGKLLKFAVASGIEVEVTCLFRNAEEQHQLYLKGNSTLDGFRQTSKHQQGRAGDLVIMRDGVPVWERNADYETLGIWWKAHGGRWGGDFKTLNDIYHFEV